MYSDTLVILAAGRGSRMQSETPKVLLEVAGKPVISHVIDFWEKEGVSKFIFVLGYKAQDVLEYLRFRDMAFKCVFQKELKGIAHAILQTESLIEDRFVVQLGDCLNIGHFDYPSCFEIGYGVWFNSYQKYLNLGCTVKVNHKGYITGVREKPDVEFPGIGSYFFDKRIFGLIRQAKPTPFRNEVEISDILNQLSGEQLKAIPFYGEFVNCTTRQDIEYADRLLGNGVKI